MVAGDWAGARELYAEVVKLQPTRQSFQLNFYLARLALHEYDALEQELRTAIGGQQLPIFDLTRLMDVLISQNRNEDAAKAIVELELKFRAQDPQSANLIGGGLRRYWLYATGQFAVLAEEASNAMAKVPVAKLG